MSTTSRTVAGHDMRLWAGAALGLVLALFATALLLPELVIPNDAAERLKRENELRTALVQGFALLGLLATAALGLWNLKVTQRGQVTERYVSAVELLGEDQKPATRIGGIVALEQIAAESPERDHVAVMELLSAYARIHAKEAEEDDGPRVHPDVQVALTVLGRRATGNDPPGYRLYLSRIHAPQVRLGGGHLERALLRDADLRDAYFKDAYLEGADFNGSDLRGAHFQGAHVDGAVFTAAQLGDATLDGMTGKGVTWVDGRKRDFPGPDAPGPRKVAP
jgi:hypothetical protein